MNIPPNLHIALGCAFLGFALLLAVANWGWRRTR